MPEPNPTPRLLFSPQEAAEALGVSLRTLQTWQKKGEIPHIRLSEKIVKYSPDALQRWAESRTVGGIETPVVAKPGVRLVDVG